MRYLLIALLLSSTAYGNCRYWGKCLKTPPKCQQEEPWFTDTNLNISFVLSADANDIFICTTPQGSVYERLYPAQELELFSYTRPHKLGRTPRSLEEIDTNLVMNLTKEAAIDCEASKIEMAAEIPSCSGN